MPTLATGEEGMAGMMEGVTVYRGLIDEGAEGREGEGGLGGSEVIEGAGLKSTGARARPGRAGAWGGRGWSGPVKLARAWLLGPWGRRERSLTRARNARDYSFTCKGRSQPWTVVVASP